MSNQMTEFGGMRVTIVPDARPPFRVRPKPPSKASGRRGTRRAWKRAHPPYTHRDTELMEIGEVLKANVPGIWGGTLQTVLYMRATTFRDLQRRLAA